MIFGESRYSSVLRIVLCVLLAALLTFALQVLPFSLRRLLIGSGVFTGPELALLEIAVGMLNALIVSLVCLLVLRRPAFLLTTAAVVVQIVGIEMAYGFRQGADTFVEGLLRYSEHVGVIIGAAAAFWIHKMVTGHRAPVSAAN